MNNGRKIAKGGEEGELSYTKSPRKMRLRRREPPARSPPRDEDEDDGSGKDYYARASFGPNFGVRTLIWWSVCASKC